MRTVAITGRASAGLMFLWLWTPAIFAQQVAPPVAKQAVEHEIVVETDVLIPARDGVKLAADLYRPAKDGKPLDGKFPALLTRSPYNKKGMAKEGEYYAARGFVVVANDVRGRYASEGTWRGLIDDPNDGYDVVEWIAAQPWSDGKVGTFGVSYHGGTQHALAEANPPHLTAMVPVDAVSNTAHGGMRHGGAFELRFMNWILQIGAPNSRAAFANPKLREALIESGLRTREHVDNLPVRRGTTALRVVPEYEQWLLDALGSGPEAEFWRTKGMSVVDHIDDYKDVPVLHVTGWYDSWTRSVVMNYEALSKAKKSPQRLVIGPWIHNAQGSNVAGEVEFTKDAGIDLKALRLRWYDRWMRDQANGVDDEPPVWIYVMGTGDHRKSPAGRLQRGGFWRSEYEWPPARAVATSMYLSGEGALTAAPPTGPAAESVTYTFDPSNPTPTIGGNISSSQGLMVAGGFDQRTREDSHPAGPQLPLSERRDVVVYRTAPLEEDIEVVGTVQVELWVSSTAPDTDFTAKLIDEIPPNEDYPLGFDLNIGDSIIRTRYREGDDHVAAPLQPGQAVRVVVPLYPTATVFKKGHRIRVDVSSSNYPRFDVNPNTGDPLNEHRRMVRADNTIHHGAQFPSRLILPVIP